MMVWTGHSGPFHDHYANGRLLALALNRTGNYSAVLADNETSFSNGDLSGFDILLIYADSYENPVSNIGPPWFFI